MHKNAIGGNKFEKFSFSEILSSLPDKDSESSGVLVFDGEISLTQNLMVSSH
jgi:hypothetical protein